MRERINYDKRTFVSVANTDNGEVSAHTTFQYHQQDDIIWAEYSGGEIIKGFLVGTVLDEGLLRFSYQHVNQKREQRMGTCLSTPEYLPDGRLRLLEQWQWLNGDRSGGHSVIEEISG